MEHDLERSPRSRNSVGSLGQNQNHRSTKASCNAGPSSRSSQAPSRTLRTLGPSRTFRAYCVRNGAMARPSLNTLITIAMATRTYFDERVIVLWAASAAVNAPNTNIPVAYADKAAEFILLGILLRVRTAR